MFFLARDRVPHARTLILKYTCHRVCHLRKTHTQADGFENVREARDRARFPYRGVALSNISLPKLPRISTKFANVVANFCHNGWRRNFSRLLPRRRINLRFSRPFVPFERIIKRRYENSHYKRNYPLLSFFLLPLLSPCLVFTKFMKLVRTVTRSPN